MSGAAATQAPQADGRAAQRKLIIRLYMAAVFMYWVSLYLYAPTLPSYVESKADNLSMVGVVLSMYGLWQALIRLPLGIVSDWLGRRKPFIIGGFLVTALGALVMGLAQGVPGLLVGRAITGLAAGTWVPLVVVFSSLFPAEESVKASSMLTLVGTIGRVLATGVTGSLNNLGGFVLPFYLAAAAGVVAALIWLSTPERVRPPKAPSLASLGRLVARGDVLLPSLLSALSQYANWTATFGFIPILAAELGASGVMQSILMSLNLVVTTGGNLAATALANRMGARNLVYLGFVLMAVGLGGAAIAKSMAFIFVAQFCIGLAQGISYPVLMGLSIRHVADEQRSTAMGLHQSVYAVGMFAGPAVSGLLADAIGIRPMFGVTAFFCLALGVYAANRLVRS
jgi:MFS family permease